MMDEPSSSNNGGLMVSFENELQPNCENEIRHYFQQFGQVSSLRIVDKQTVHVVLGGENSEANHPMEVCQVDYLTHRLNDLSRDITKTDSDVAFSKIEMIKVRHSLEDVVAKVLEVSAIANQLRSQINQKPPP